MRFASKVRIIGAVLAMCAAAVGQQKINPATQINWPSGCQVYNVAQASCPPVGTISFLGNWDSTVTYTLNQAVFYQGSQYISIQAGNLNNIPSTATTFWSIFSSGLSPNGGNFSVQYADNNALGGANFTGFLYNNGSSAPPGAATQAQLYALAGGTPALVAHTNVFTVSGAANQPAMTLNGTIFSAGTATSTKPLFLIETSGLPSTSWSTSGTAFGINVPASPTFGGNIFDFQVNGVSIFSLSENGSLTTRGSVSATILEATQTSSGSYFLGNGGAGTNPVYNVPTGVTIIPVDCTSFAVTVNLPSLPQGQELIIKKIDSSANAVTVSGNGHTIDGAATQTITSQYGVLRITSVGGTTPTWYLF